jgi:hypothetical protein
MIAFTCVGCGKSFRVDEGLAGRRSRCEKCGAVTRIPSPGPPPVAPASRPTPAPTVTANPPAPAPEVPRRPGPRKRKKKTSDRDAWVSLAIGAGLAAIALAVPLIGLVPAVLMTVIHELGHVATAWLVGSPAVPSFDLTYGGGVTHAFDRQPLLIVVIYGVFAFLAFRARDDRPALITVLIAVALYSVATFSPLRDLLITAMGHGMELLIAGVFLYRALSGSQIIRGAERPLYAFLGLYIVLDGARFAFRLIASREHREDYGEAKGGGHLMDFSRIADQHMQGRLEVIAALFLMACALTPLAAFLVHRYGRRRK